MANDKLTATLKAIGDSPRPHASSGTFRRRTRRTRRRKEDKDQLYLIAHSGGKTHDEAVAAREATLRARHEQDLQDQLDKQTQDAQDAVDTDTANYKAGLPRSSTSWSRTSTRARKRTSSSWRT
jgi:hypothetical protein